MSGGGGKPEEVKASTGEKMQAQLAKDQIAHYRSTYAPLEAEFRDVAGQDVSDRFAARNATAVSRETTDLYRATGMGGNSMDTSSLAEALTGSRISGWAAGRRERDDGRLDSLDVGLGVSADATKSLGLAGQIQTEAAIDKTREEIAKQQAKMELQSAVIGAAGTLGGAYATPKLMEAKQGLTDQREVSTLRSTNPEFRTAENRLGTSQALMLARGNGLGAAKGLGGTRNMYRGR